MKPEDTLSTLEAVSTSLLEQARAATQELMREVTPENAAASIEAVQEIVRVTRVAVEQIQHAVRDADQDQRASGTTRERTITQARGGEYSVESGPARLIDRPKRSTRARARARVTTRVTEHAVAELPPEVPRLKDTTAATFTVTARSAPQDTGEGEVDARALIEASSLGTPAARRLRERTPASRAAEIRELSRLTAAVEAGQWWHLADLAEWHRRAGNLAQAETYLRVLAASALSEIAAVNHEMGRDQAADTWNARANTLT